MVRVAVVGGGAGGIVCAKRLADAGAAAGVAVDVVGFERQAELGGVWILRDAADGGKMYHGLRTNTDKLAMEFPDFPVPRHWPPFLSHWQCREYLQAFAAHFDIGRVFRMRTSVVGWRRSGGRWLVSSAGADGAEREEAFDVVCVCSGQTAVPHVPQIRGIGRFRGRVLHSSEYRHVGPFAGKVVLVVGLGYASGSDIAQELSFGAKQTYLSTRRGATGIPRLTDGRPWDSTGQAMAYYHLTAQRQRVMGRLAAHTAAAQAHGAGPQQSVGIPRFGANDRIGGEDGERPDGPFHEVFTDCCNLAQRAAVGAVRVNASGIREFTPTGVVFGDGEERALDCVIFATGYRRGMGAASAGTAGASGELRLWNYIFHDEHPGLAYVLAVHPGGPHWPLADLQSRFIAAVVVGRLALPPPAVLRRDAVRIREHQGLTAVHTASEVTRLCREMGRVKPTRRELWRMLLRPATRARALAYLNSMNTMPWRHPDDIAPWPLPSGALWDAKL